MRPAPLSACRRLAPVAFFTALGAAWFFFRFLNPAFIDRHEVSAINSDTYTLFLPMQRYFYEEVRAGRFPLWNPHSGAGLPFFASHLFGHAYPGNILHLVLPTHTAMGLTLVLHLGLAGFFMWILLGRFALRAPARLLGAVAFMLSGFLALTVWHPSFLAALALYPLLIHLLLRLLDRPTATRTLALGAVAAIFLLAGSMQYALYFVWMATAVFAADAVRRRGRGLPARATALAAAGALAAGLAAFQILPAFSMSRLGMRPPGGLTAAQVLGGSGLRPLEWLRHLLDSHDRPDMPETEFFFQRLAYAGIPVVLLAAAGLASRRRALALLLALAVVVPVLFAGPLFPLLHALPGGDMFRWPRRLLAFTTLALAILAALGLESLLPVSPRRAPVLVAAAAGLAVLVFGPPLAKLWTVLTGAGLAAIVLSSSERGRAAAAFGIVAILCVDLGIHNGNRFAHAMTEPELSWRYMDVRREVRRRIGTDRCLYDREDGQPLERGIPAKVGLLDRVHAASDYEAMTPRLAAEYTNFLTKGRRLDDRLEFAGNPQIVLNAHAVTRKRLLDLLGVAWFATPRGGRTAEIMRVVTGDGTGALVHVPDSELPGDTDLFRNRGALPRAHVVGRVEVIADPDAVLERLVHAGFDPNSTAVLHGPPAGFAPGGGGTTVIEDYAAERIVVRTSGGGGLLVLRDQYDPDWRAAVDGRPAEILRADFLFRGVPVPPGEHRVVFTYEPASFRLGLILSAVSGLLFIPAAAVAARRSRRTAVSGARSSSSTSRS